MKDKYLAECLQFIAKMSGKYKVGVPYYIRGYTIYFSEHGQAMIRHEAKNYHIIKDWHDGTKELIAKRHPPASKGIKRDRTAFRKNDRKLYNSITRTKQTIFELAKCNRWTYFVTFTMDKEKYNRYDLKTFMKAFTKWLNNYSNQKIGNGKRIEYLLIPEKGRRDAWHLHGLMKGIPRKHLSRFVEGKHKQRLIDEGWLNWKAYADKFGFCCLGKIRSKEAVVQYSMKKIKKSTITQMRRMGEPLYYCSKGLKRPTEIARGHNLVPTDDFDYEDEWVGKKWIYEDV